MNRMLLLELPLTEYWEALRIQRSVVERKLLRGGPDVLILVEHPPTVTLGKRGLDSHLLVSKEELLSRGVAFYQVDRGGGATFHGPGQLVCYPVLELRNHGIRVRDYVRRLEDTIITTLEAFGVTGFRQEGKVGVWTNSMDKIASIGIRVRRGITFHGFSINIDLEMDPGDFIISCDMPDARIVNLNAMLQTSVGTASVKDEVARSFRTVFRVDLERASVDKALS